MKIRKIDIAKFVKIANRVRKILREEEMKDMLVCKAKEHLFLNPQVRDKTTHFGWAWECRKCGTRKDWFPDE